MSCILSSLSIHCLYGNWNKISNKSDHFSPLFKSFSDWPLPLGWSKHSITRLPDLALFIFPFSHFSTPSLHSPHSSHLNILHFPIPTLLSLLLDLYTCYFPWPANHLGDLISTKQSKSWKQMKLRVPFCNAVPQSRLRGVYFFHRDSSGCKDTAVQLYVVSQLHV